MVKRFKFLSAVSALFISITVLLVGCGSSSVPYKKGDTYKDSKDNFITITAENEWRVKGSQNSEATYKVESTEYKADSLLVVAISVKEKINGSDPLFVVNDYHYYILSPKENGFSLTPMGTSHPNSAQWKEFKEGFKDASNKEGFLKKEVENVNKQNIFKKTN
ncbi:DUF5512 family protein [Bacillus thuringiensis]|uniref:Lipoprotein n=1 Tax=Bacillus thuringiensis subsp. kurstaki TaxID=29339 RepID=Q3YN34_BACTK|nr:MULTISPECIES: DUF5512 family protein [Bacillus cereus group]MEB9963596.1 DUF5512 family protein [Bacillus cereus]AAZ06611.1 hypothetical protein pAW63_041 [Bacillus thuringiensis serovar kurstaki]AGE81688.1 hypothetical protein HD73_7541 [Bacillus thuringiensis serovar kurstaki str. HD73]AND11268.1 hypothetical protein Bt4C1_28850 [Bacillus thuringiensis serovar alesti]EJV73153.1 hypothetical protein IG1_05902 [Bacillus cereus HD73]